jgi:hypothetical protein
VLQLQSWPPLLDLCAAPASLDLSFLAFLRTNLFLYFGSSIHSWVIWLFMWNLVQSSFGLFAKKSSFGLQCLASAVQPFYRCSSSMCVDSLILFLTCVSFFLWYVLSNVQKLQVQLLRNRLEN